MATNPYCKVQQSPIHGRGLYARCAIEAGMILFSISVRKFQRKNRVVERLSGRQKRASEVPGLVYIFELDDEWDLDGRRGRNPARYINHSCDGNCEAINYEGEIWIVARKAIAAGEELTYDYGYDMEHFLDHPCRCGTDNCIGYIVRQDQWSEVRKLLRQRS